MTERQRGDRPSFGETVVNRDHGIPEVGPITLTAAGSDMGFADCRIGLVHVYQLKVFDAEGGTVGVAFPSQRTQSAGQRIRFYNFGYETKDPLFAALREMWRNMRAGGAAP